MRPLFDRYDADLAVHAVHALGCMIMEHAFPTLDALLALSPLIALAEGAKQAAFRGRSMWALANLVDVLTPFAEEGERVLSGLRSSLLLALSFAQKYEIVALLFFNKG